MNVICPDCHKIIQTDRVRRQKRCPACQEQYHRERMAQWYHDHIEDERRRSRERYINSQAHILRSAWGPSESRECWRVDESRLAEPTWSHNTILAAGEVRALLECKYLEPDTILVNPKTGQKRIVTRNWKLRDL